MLIRNLLYNDANISYQISTAKGPTVVMIHGFGEDGTVWQNQLELSTKYQIIVPDLPGSGLSAPLNIPPGEQKIDAYAAVIFAILKAEKIESCTLVGHSMGGYIALSILRKYETICNGIAMVHSTIFSDSEERISIRKKGISFIRQHGAHSFLRQAIPNLFAPRFVTEYPDIVAQFIDRSSSFSNEVLIQYYEAMIERPDSVELLRTYRKPVLFIIGEEDKSVSLQDSLKQSHIPEISHIKIFPNVAHMGMWEEKNQVTALLENYINNLVDGCRN